MFFLYQSSIFLLILISPLIIIFRIIKGKEDISRIKEKFCLFSKTRKNGKVIWFHGSSVGEIMSIIPLIYQYEKDKSINQILITSSTLSSAKILNKYKFKKSIHQFFPLDFIFFSKFFLNYWKPSIAIFIESEIWPSIYRDLNKKKIPLILLNARITKKTFNRWLIIKKYSSSIFKNISSTYPQNIETINYLKKLDVKNIKFIGNLKFIENPYDKKDNKNIEIKNLFKNYKKWVAASTHEDEEIICARAHMILKKNIKNLITIIIPRHINRKNEILSKLKSLNLNVVCHSSKLKNLNKTDIYLVDTYGESKKFYKISKTVFLGGSLSSRGGQNPLEAARYGSKILHGDNVQNFKDIYKYLNLLNISRNIKTSKQIASSIKFQSAKNNNYEIKKMGQEILRKTLNELNIFIKNAD